MTDLYWLPEIADWRSALKSARGLSNADARWREFVALANHKIDFTQTNALDRAAQSAFSDVPPPGLTTRPVRLAILSSSTIDHLIPAIRVGAMRRGIWLQILRTEYGQYQQALFGLDGSLRDFQPDAIHFVFDAQHVVSMGQTAEDAIERLAGLWEQARAINGASIAQMTFAPVFPHLLGAHEHRFSASPAARVRAINDQIRDRADEHAVSLIDLDRQISRDGLDSWYDRGLWYRAKQEIHPAAAPVFGDLTGRLLGAEQGLSAKALVLDLDNTLWGGVIGDDGLDGIRLGQGDAAGEAFVAFQSYAKALTDRGVILAVCSKNDEANALAPFSQHPDMILKREDIAAFVANWEDKATNLRRIAKMLNIGIDSLVFADDNPFERNLVRRELPMVRTPELPEDPAHYASCLADAGYFEALKVTAEDKERAAQYQADAQRESLKVETTDLDSYLKSLDLELSWQAFDPIGLPRIAQLINKTNQFNLTTKRRTEAETESLMSDKSVLALQLRLNDTFGDNGMISVVIAIPDKSDKTRMTIDTWLMSCRVLGRQVEEATMNILAEQARARGVRQLTGVYVPTAKNEMVRLHYDKLGFEPVAADGDTQMWQLDLASYAPFPTHIKIVEASNE